MGLTTSDISVSFDKSKIARGDLIRIKHKNMTEPVNGIVAEVSDNKLVIFYLPGLRNVSNFMTVSVSDFETGEWEAVWSSDLEDIHRDGGENDA